MISLSRDLEECDIILKHLNFHADLDNCENLTKIIKRLPFASQTRWLRIAADIEKRGLDPKFDDVVNFGKEKAKVARSLLSGVVYQRSKGTERISNHSTNIAVSHHETPEKLIKCWLCAKNHYLWECSGFINKEFNNKIFFMRQLHLRDDCFKGVTWHGFADVTI